MNLHSDHPTRRDVLTGALAIASTVALRPQSPGAIPDDLLPLKGNPYMTTGFVKTSDGTQIFYKDWGSGQPIVFHHGWPLSADDWDPQMLFFLQKGYRVIAHDRRGHGRSSQTDHGNDMDTYAADVAALAKELDLRDAVHVGHSTGGGEVTRYVAQHGKGRVAKAVLIGAVPPWSNPNRIRVVCPWRSSTASENRWPSTGASSFSKWRAGRSTGSIDRTPSHPKPLCVTGGVRP